MNRMYPRPTRRLDAQALALDAPAPLVVTCKGMGLPWPGAPRPKADEGDTESLLASCPPPVIEADVQWQEQHDMRREAQMNAAFHALEAEQQRSLCRMELDVDTEYDFTYR